MSVAAEYRKALANYNPGAPTRSLTDQAAALAAGTLSPSASDSPWTAAMGPGVPLPAQPLDLPQRGVQLPRRWQYPVGTNLTVSPGSTKLVDFRTLRMLAKMYDVARRCIEIRRQEIASMRWEITPRDPKQKVANDADRLKALTNFFEYPDRINGRRWDGWIKTLLEEVFVVDALAIYPHPTWLPGKGANGCDLFALEILDGTTIKPLLDNRGARPLPPLPAYQQVLYGVPRTEMQADSLSLDLRPTPPLANQDVTLKEVFSGEELYYEIYNPASDSPYGFSNIEQIIVNVNLALKRQQYWTSYFTDGTIPAGIIQVPEDWDAKQIREFEEGWNSLLASEIAWKQRVKAAPGAFSQMRPLVGEGAGVVLFDEWLAKITCIGFDVTPTELGLDPKSGLGGTGWSEQQENVLYRKSLRPLVGWIEVLLNEVLATWLQSPDLQFRFIFDEIEDALKKSQQMQVNFESAVKTVNENRSDLGLPPSSEPNANKLIVITRQGPSLLEDIDAISKNNAGLNRDGSPLPALAPAAGGKTFTGASTSRATERPNDDPARDPSGSAAPAGDATKVTKASESELRDPKTNQIDLKPAALRRVVKATATVPTVILARHGSTKNNEQNLIRGWTDPPLSADGKKDAQTLAGAFKGVDVYKLYCSGLVRSCDTADAIGKSVGVDAVADERFKPWNLGDFQGKPVPDSFDQVNDLMTKTPNKSAPGGESFNDFLGRYIPALKDAMAAAEEQPTKYVVIVAHMRNMRAAQAWLDAGQKGNKVSTDVLTSDDEVGPGGFFVMAKEDGKWGVPDAYTEEFQRETGAAQKAADPLDDLTKWRTKALKAQKAGRAALVAFTSDAIPAALKVAVTAQLAQATTDDQVKAVFADAIRDLHSEGSIASGLTKLADAFRAAQPKIDVHVAAPHVEVAAPPAPAVNVHVDAPKPIKKRITMPDGKVTIIEEQ